MKRKGGKELVREGKRSLRVVRIEKGGTKGEEDETLTDWKKEKLKRIRQGGRKWRERGTSRVQAVNNLFTTILRRRGGDRGEK